MVNKIQFQGYNTVQATDTVSRLQVLKKLGFLWNSRTVFIVAQENQVMVTKCFKSQTASNWPIVPRGKVEPGLLGTC